MSQQPLKLIGTLNLWGKNFWDQRREYLIEVLRMSGFTNQNKVILALQEAVITNGNQLEDIAYQLGFNKHNIFCFPNPDEATSGLAFISNLEVLNTKLKKFPLPPGFIDGGGYNRSLAILDAKLDQDRILVGNTHFSYHPKELQTYESKECINYLKSYIIDSLQLPPAEKEKLKNSTFNNFLKYIKIIVTGDFNADNYSEAYNNFVRANFDDWTKPLRTSRKITWPINNKLMLQWPIQKTNTFTWPPDLNWYINIHIKEMGKPPHYEINQRWMDYIWGCGIKAKRIKLIGTESKTINWSNNETNGNPEQYEPFTIYISDHLVPVAYF